MENSLKDKYWDSSTDKQMVISVVGTNIAIDNSMLENGTFTLEESLCSESELKFGSCEANSVKFTARNMAGGINGKTISISETVDGDAENLMPYGVFKVVSDVPTADRTKRQITAYDAMYDIINADVKSWYAGLSFPMTLKQFRDSFFAHLGIEQAAAALPNDSMTVNKTLVATQTDDSSVVTEEAAISGKTVITAICEINGCFGNINRYGKFEYVTLKQIISPVYPAEDLFPSESLFPAEPNSESMTGNYVTFDYEDFDSKAITQLEIRASDDSSGVTVGKDGNNYTITGNFLVSDKSSDELKVIANNILPIIAQAAYTPIKSSTCIGNPCLEVGDAIRFNTSKAVVETYILQRTLTGVQSKRDSITSQGTETHNAKVNSIRDTISSVQSRTNRLERTADHTLSEIKSLGESTEKGFSDMSSTIEQTANGLKRDYEQKITEYDTKAQGYASTAESNANSATDGKLQNYTQTTEMKNLIEETAEGTKQEITKTITEYDTKAQGYASTAESNANAATDDKLKNYTQTTEMNNIIENTAEGTKQEISKTLTSYATKTDAQGYANTAESNANSSTDGKLKNYSTTTEMRTEIQKSAEGVEQTVSKTYSTKTEAQGYASAAESNSNAATDEKLEDYATTVEMDTKFAQTAHSIEMTATGGDQTVGIKIEIVDANGNVIDTAESNANITVTGFVSFWDLLNAGSTSINGANITTGYISCDRLNGGTISGQKLSGCYGEFTDGAESLRLKYSDDYYMGLRAGYLYIHNSASPNSMQGILADTQIRFGVNSNADCWGDGVGSLSPTYYMEVNKYGTINFSCRNLTKNNSSLATESQIPDVSNFITASYVSNYYHSLSQPYGDAYASEAVTSVTEGTHAGQLRIATHPLKGSDGRLKDISEIPDFEKVYMDFKPIKFKYKDGLLGYDKGVHFGLEARETKEVFEKNGFHYDDFAMVWTEKPKEKWNENQYVLDDKLYRLDKDELHALHIQMIQKHQKKIKQLELENFTLNGEIDILKQRLNQMEEMLNVVNSKIS